MTKNQLVNEIRARLQDEELLVLALSCADCGRLKLPLAQAVALAAEVDTLDQWFDLVDRAEHHTTPPQPLPLLPPVSVVAPHCQELAERAAKRRRTPDESQYRRETHFAS